MSHPTTTETQLVQNTVDALEPYAQPLIPPSLPLRLFPTCKPLSPLERAAAAASSASSEPTPPTPNPSPSSSAPPRGTLSVHRQMPGPACYSMSAPAQTRVYMTPKADATALPDNREILILEDMTDEQKREYGIKAYTTGAVVRFADPAVARSSEAREADADSDDDILPNLESVDVGSDSPMPALEPDSPRPTIVLVPAEPWLLPAMTAFDEDRATAADRALLAFGNMYADVTYWATRNPAARCNNCVAICDAAAAYAAAVHAAAPPPTPSSPRAPKPMSAGEKAKVDAIMASHRIVSLLPRDSTDRAPRPLSAAEMRKAKVDAIMTTNPALRASLLTPVDADPRAPTKEDVHPAVAAFAPPDAAREPVRIEQSESTPTHGAMQGEPSGSRSMPFVDRFAVRMPPSPPVD